MASNFGDQPSAATGEPGATEAAASLERTFAVGPHAQVHLENPRGRVRIRGWDRPEVALRAVKRSDGSEVRFAATHVEVMHEGDRVAVRTVLDPASAVVATRRAPGIAADLVRAIADFVPLLQQPSPVDYDLSVPRQSAIEVKGVACRIELDDVEGPVRLRSVSGELRLADLRGDLELRSVSGGVIGRGLVGRLTAETVSGELSLDGALAAVAAKTVSGAITVTGPLSPTGHYEFRTVSGDLTLRVPTDTRASFSVHGVSAAVHAALPCEVVHQSRAPGARSWRGQLNSGGAAVGLHTVSGNLFLQPLIVGGVPTGVESPSAESPAEPAPPPADVAEPAPTPAETAELNILRALERGELSVDAALAQLAARGHRS